MRGRCRDTQEGSTTGARDGVRQPCCRCISDGRPCRPPLARHGRAAPSGGMAAALLRNPGVAGARVAVDDAESTRISRRRPHVPPAYSVVTADNAPNRRAAVTRERKPALPRHRCSRSSTCRRSSMRMIVLREMRHHGTVRSDPAIAVSQLTRRFGANTALDSVTLDVVRGGVHGLVGANGAGKTTLIKHILGLLKAQGGTVRVFGLDPVADPVGVLSRIGYLSEENDLPGWMRLDELLRYTRAFYPGWDDAYAEDLRGRFALDPAAKIKTLSKGQKARTGLVIALAYRPELLVLDEPSSGLDPIVRRDILGAILRTIAGEGRTVLFSSHLLEEVEQVADHVTMMRQGKVVVNAPLNEVKEAHGGASLDEIFVERMGGV